MDTYSSVDALGVLVGCGGRCGMWRGVPCLRFADFYAAGAFWSPYPGGEHDIDH